MWEVNLLREKFVLFVQIEDGFRTASGPASVHSGCRQSKPFSGFLYGDQMVNFLYHTQDRGGVLFHYGVVHLLDAEGVEGAFLHGRSADAAFGLSYFNLCHFIDCWNVKKVGD